MPLRHPSKTALIMEPLQFRLIPLVLRPYLLGRCVLADLCRRDIPPDASAWQRPVLFHFHDDHGWSLLGARFAQSFLELLRRLDVPDAGAEAFGVLGEIDLHVLAFQPFALLIPMA